MRNVSFTQFAESKPLDYEIIGFYQKKCLLFLKDKEGEAHSVNVPKRVMHLMSLHSLCAVVEAIRGSSVASIDKDILIGRAHAQAKKEVPEVRQYPSDNFWERFPWYKLQSNTDIASLTGVPTSTVRRFAACVPRTAAGSSN